MANRTRSRSKQSPRKPLGGLSVLLIVLIVGFATRFLLVHLTHLAIPVAFIIWLALLLGAATKKYPLPPQGSKEPDEKQVSRYKAWKNLQAGMIPANGAVGKYWLNIRRISWWVGWAIGFLAGADGGLAYVLTSLLFSFMSVMGITYWRDRAADIRHPYTGVSIPAFLRNGGGIKVGTTITLSVLTCITSALICIHGTLTWNVAAGSTMLMFLMSAWLFSRKAQSARWRRTVEMQTMLDQWFSAGALQKAYPSVYVTQCDIINPGDNPLTVVRFRIQDPEGNGYGNTTAFKLGASAIMPIAQPAGYGFVCLLGAKTKGKGFDHDPNAIRLVLAKDASAVPDASQPGMDEKLATLVCDIAYAMAAIPWKKRPPLTRCHQISKEPDKANAWLIELHQPPQDANPLDRIGIDWLPNPQYSPAQWMHLPMLSDVNNRFHLAAEPDTPLTDAGNKWREQGFITAKPEFDTYIKLTRRYNNDLATLSEVLKGTKLDVPTLYYDGIRTMGEQGWEVNLTPLLNTGTTSASDYARFDWKLYDSEAEYVGIINNLGTTTLVSVTGRVPNRIDRITASSNGARFYMQSLVFTTLVNLLPAKTQVNIDSLSQEGKDCALWRIRFHLDGGGTMADVRKRTAQISASLGATHVYLDWQTSDSGILWLTGDPMLDIDQLNHWKRAAFQKELIQLALSDAWGVAGVYDTEGRTPGVEKLGTLPHNQKVLLARFEVPGGISVDKPKNNIDKFLTKADYMYGRVLPRGDEHGARLFDMVLAKHSPFPMSVKADFESVMNLDGRIFPFGVDDMGEVINWRLKSTPHLVIEGKSGTGKSSAMQIVVAEALLRGGKIMLIDPSKGCVDFTKWAKTRALAFVGEGQMRETEAALGWAEHEMRIRVALNTKYGVGNIYDLNPQDVDEADREHLYPLYICFDEFNSYLQKAGKVQSNPNHDFKLANSNAQINATNTSISRAMDTISAIATQGRTAGVHLIIGAQRLGMRDLDSYNGGAFFRSTGRILLGTDTAMGVITQPNVVEAHRLQKQLKGAGGKIPAGRGLYESMDGILSSVQTWFYSKEQSDFAELVKDVPEVEPVDITPYMPVEAESFGEMSQDSIREELEKAKKNDAADATALEALFGTGVEDDEDDMREIHI